MHDRRATTAIRTVDPASYQRLRDHQWSGVLSGQAMPSVGFWRLARAFYAAHGITVRAELTDNGACYRSTAWTGELATAGITPRFTRRYRPQANGKVERMRHEQLSQPAR